METAMSHVIDILIPVVCFVIGFPVGAMIYHCAGKFIRRLKK